MPGIRQREGGRSGARQGAGDTTAEGSRHAEGQTTGPVEPHRDPEGEGNQEKTELGQGGQAGRHAIDLTAENIPSISLSGTRRIFAKAPSVRGPPGQAREERGALFKQSLPCWPWVLGVHRSLTPMPYRGKHPGDAMQAADCCGWKAQSLTLSLSHSLSLFLYLP